MLMVVLLRVAGSYACNVSARMTQVNSFFYVCFRIFVAYPMPVTFFVLFNTSEYYVTLLGVARGACYCRWNYLLEIWRGRGPLLHEVQQAVPTVIHPPRGSNTKARYA